MYMKNFTFKITRTNWNTDIFTVKCHFLAKAQADLLDEIDSDIKSIETMSIKQLSDRD